VYVFVHSIETRTTYDILWLLLGVEMEPKAMMDMTLVPHSDPIDIGLGSSDKSNSVPPKRKKTMTSVYLKYFETAPDSKTRKCKFCGQSYSIATATGIILISSAFYSKSF